MTRRLATHLIAFLVGAFALPLAAQITDNDAMYGRLLGAGVATFLATPSSANFASAVTGETGSGALVFGSNPTITQTPIAVGSLAACGAGTANQIAIVNDALLPALGGAVANGGLLTVGVICKNGTGWLVY